MVKHLSPMPDEIELMQKFYDVGNSLRETQKKFGRSRPLLIKYLKTRQPKNISLDEKQKRKVNRVISWRQRTKKALVKYKGGKCQGCGYDRCISCLDFHHIDPTEKEVTISGSTISFEKQKIEVDKCVLVCKNCHGEIHAGLRGFTTITISLNYNQTNKRLLDLYKKYNHLFGFRGHGGNVPPNIKVEKIYENDSICEESVTSFSFAASGMNWTHNFKLIKNEFPDLHFEISIFDAKLNFKNEGVKSPKLYSGLA